MEKKLEKEKKQMINEFEKLTRTASKQTAFDKLKSFLSDKPKPKKPFEQIHKLKKEQSKLNKLRKKRT